MDLTHYQLDNGMKVLLLPSSTAPVVACNVWVGVGSADETPDEAGLAHVHEHMLFKGTEHRGVGELAREVEAAGGHINAFTSFDQTCYYVVMSSRFFESGLDILSDAIRHSSFDAEELERELEVIQEEIKRGDDNPSRVASLKLFETAYDVHPYRLPVIGTKESVDSFAREDVLNFFHKHYVPENMTVVLAGDFDPDDARAKVEHYFGDFSGPSYESVRRAQEPEQHGLKAVVMPKAAQNVHLRTGFHIPHATHEDIPALEMLGLIMGQGEASHLYQKIQREAELVHGIYAGSYTPREAGLFMISADYQLAKEDGGPGAPSHEEVITAIMHEAFRFRDITVSDADIRRARTILESQAVYSKQTIEGLAMKLGQYQMVTGDPLYEEVYYARLATIGVQELREVARRYLTPDNWTAVLSHAPDDPGATPDTIEEWVRRAFDSAREQTRDAKEVHLDSPTPPPVEQEAGATRTVTLDEDNFAVIDLDGGPRVIVQENHSVELFSLRLLGLGGLRVETPETNGIHSLLTDLITKGTSELGASEISHRVESMASSLSGISGRNTFGMAMSGLSKYFEPCVDIFAQCLLDSTIPAEEFERARRQQIQEIRSRRDQLGAVNFDNFAPAFFGEYPYSMPTSGTINSISELTAEDVRAHLNRVVDLEGMTLVIVGDVDAARAADVLEEAFGRYPKPDSAALALPEAPDARTAPKLVTQDLEKNQAHIIVGFDAPTIRSDDRYALEVLHSVLSGQGGRLFYELRDRQSLAYSVYASMLLGLDASSFMLNIGTSPEKIEQALAGIIHEVRRLNTEPPSAEEIANAKRYLIGHNDIGLQRNSTRAMSVALDNLYDLGFKRSFQYGEHIESVTAADLQALIGRILDLDRVVVSITKPEAVEVPKDLLTRILEG